MIPFALKNGNAATDRIVVADSATVNGLTACSVVMWLQPTTFTDLRRLFGITAVAGSGTGQKMLRLSGTAGVMDSTVDRATSDSNTGTITSTLTLNIPNFVVWTYSEADGIRVFTGTHVTPPTEASYSARVIGSGATVSDSGGGGFGIGNMNIGTWGRGIQGRLFSFTYVPVALTYGQILEWYRTGVPQAAPRIHFPRLAANGTGSVLDRSGNGNNGTITGSIPTNDALPRTSRRR